MIDWPALITIVTIITGGIVGLGTLWINSRVGQLQRMVTQQTATIASLHAIIMGQHDPIMAIEGALHILKTHKHAPEFDVTAPGAKEQRFPQVAER